MNPELRRCRSCDESFLARARQTIYCSGECKEAVKFWRRRVWCSAGCGRLILVNPRTGAAEPMCRGCRSRQPRPRAVPAQRDCRKCGQRFVPKHSSVTSCSQACANFLRGAAQAANAKGIRRAGRTCAICGATYRATYAEQRACSRACGVILKGQVPAVERAPSCRVYFPACDQCGKVFSARSSSARRCSAQCAIDATGVRVKDLYGTALRLGFKSTPGWIRLLYRYLAERDGTQCGICRKPVDLRLKSGTRGSDLGPSVDHIVPRSEGGSDDPANLRLTHWGCNRSRRTGAKGEAVQLAIVG